MRIQHNWLVAGVALALAAVPAMTMAPAGRLLPAATRWPG